MGHSSSLLPREHGAYAQLSFPLATGLGLSGFSVPGLALAAAAVAFFLANEPVAVLLGIRGKRVLDQRRRSARSRATLLLGLATGLGLLGVWAAGTTIWHELAAPLGASVLLALLTLRGRQKTLLGEIVVITAVSSLVLPLAATGGGSTARALLAASVWWTSFALGTLEVHAIKARIKEKAKHRWTRWGSPVAAAGVVATALWLALGQGAPALQRWAENAANGTSGVLEPSAILEVNRLLPGSAAAVVPPAVAILTLSVLQVHPRHLKRVGWTLVAANSLTLILLLQG